MIQRRSAFSLLLLLFSTSTITPAMAFDIMQPLPTDPVIPADNPQTPAKVSLGKHLYFDPRLSADKSLSCQSCHNLASGGDDDGALTQANGYNVNRSAPSIYNSANQTVQFWEGRVESLEDAFIDHLLDPNVLNQPSEKALEKRLNAISGYKEMYAKAFGNAEISAENTAKAVSAFVRTLKTPNSRFDHYMRGDKTQLSATEKRGMELFNERGCLACHFGSNFAGPAPGPSFKMGDGFYELFPNLIGSKYDKQYRLIDDVGRAAVTQQRDHVYLWRVPSLRNVALTAPYFHNGKVNDLAEAVRIMGRVQFNIPVSEQDVADIVAFLNSLTGEFPEITLPRLPDTAGRTLSE